MSKISVYLCLVLGVFVVGLATGVIIMMPQARPGRAFAERCARQVQAVEAWPAEERADFLRVTAENPELRARWAVMTACAGVKFD